jgi:hypothetical protein
MSDGSADQVIKTNGSGQLSFVDQTVVLEANRNKIINGNFDVWQRGTSFSALGYGADRWRSYYTGGTTTVYSQQSFTLGQTDVPDNPEFYARLVVTSDSTSGLKPMPLKIWRLSFCNILAQAAVQAVM